MINKFFTYMYTNLFKIFPVSLNIVLSKFFKKLYDMHISASYSKNFEANLNIEGNTFKLLLMKNDKQAQGVYQKLHNKNESYETIMVRTLLKSIEFLDLKNFLDIGSFMGFYACLVASKFKKNVDIYAIESNPNYSNYIEKSVKLNNFNNIKIINKILSDKKENLFIKNETVVSNTNPEENLINLEAITLDELCRNENINPEIIKIDVHGAEGKVISGSKKIFKNTKIILLELHSTDFLRNFSNGLSKKEIISKLIESNFDCYLVSSFRNYNFFKQKYDFKKIDLQNFEFIFFDRDQSDQFIFCKKNDIDLKLIDLFNQSFN